MDLQGLSLVPPLKLLGSDFKLNLNGELYSIADSSYFYFRCGIPLAKKLWYRRRRFNIEISQHIPHSFPGALIEVVGDKWFVVIAYIKYFRNTKTLVFDYSRIGRIIDLKVVKDKYGYPIKVKLFLDNGKKVSLKRSLYPRRYPEPTSEELPSLQTKLPETVFSKLRRYFLINEGMDLRCVYRQILRSARALSWDGLEVPFTVPTWMAVIFIPPLNLLDKYLAIAKTEAERDYLLLVNSVIALRLTKRPNLRRFLKEDYFLIEGNADISELSFRHLAWCLDKKSPFEEQVLKYSGFPGSYYRLKRLSAIMHKYAVRVSQLSMNYSKIADTISKVTLRGRIRALGVFVPPNDSLVRISVLTREYPAVLNTDIGRYRYPYPLEYLIDLDISLSGTTWDIRIVDRRFCLYRTYYKYCFAHKVRRGKVRKTDKGYRLITRPIILGSGVPISAVALSRFFPFNVFKGTYTLPLGLDFKPLLRYIDLNSLELLEPNTVLKDLQFHSTPYRVLHRDVYPIVTSVVGDIPETNNHWYMPKIIISTEGDTPLPVVVPVEENNET